MSGNSEIRRLPKKSVITIAVIILIGVGYYILSTQLRNAKLEEILINALGYKNIQDVYVYKSSQVEDPDTKKKGTLYAVSFRNNETNKECKGFVLFDYKREYSTDLDCKWEKWVY